jgi:hypothetical protein
MKVRRLASAALLIAAGCASIAPEGPSEETATMTESLVTAGRYFALTPPPTPAPFNPASGELLRLETNAQVTSLPGPTGAIYELRFDLRIDGTTSRPQSRTLRGTVRLTKKGKYALRADWNGRDDAGALFAGNQYRFTFRVELVRVSPQPAMLELALTSAGGLYTYVGSATNVVCGLVGDGRHNPATLQPNLNVWGTDLGFTTQLGDEIYAFFGDTWTQEALPCTGTEPGYENADDLLGVIDADANPNQCLDIAFEATGNDFDPIRVFDGGAELPMAALRTPQAPFSDGNDLYMVAPGPLLGQFCTDDGDCGPDWDCLGYCSASIVPCVVDNDCPGVETCTYPGLCGDADDPEEFAWARQLVISRSSMSPVQEFDVVVSYLSAWFVNVTAQTVNAFSEANPALNDYENDAPEELLMFGRRAFIGNPPDDVYMLHASLEDIAGGDFEPRYFAGMVMGAATWTSNPKDAAPIITGASESLNYGNGDFEPIHFSGQMSVAAIPPIGLSDLRWMMLYGGRLGYELDQGTGADPANDRIGVVARYAIHPFGPWSQPAMFYNPHEDGGYGTILFDAECAGMCVESDPGRSLSNLYDDALCPIVPGVIEDEGAEYGVSIIDAFTTPGIAIDTADLHWLMSTWNPYRVVQMKTRISSPVITAP